MHAEALIGAILPMAQGLQVPAPENALNVFAEHAEHCSLLVS
jgi:hypothetical protein